MNLSHHLPQPLPLQEVLATIVEPTYARILPGLFRSREATVLLLAIGLQESRFQHRQQVGGPARGFWQFERPGGVKGVLGHQATWRYASAACLLRSVSEDSVAVYSALDSDDLLACAFARLLLYSDPKPLPGLGDAESAWQYYVRCWRPGKPHRKTWDWLYDQALAAVS